MGWASAQSAMLGDAVVCAGGGTGVGAVVGTGVGRGVGAVVGTGIGRGVGAVVGTGIGRGDFFHIVKGVSDIVNVT